MILATMILQAAAGAALGKFGAAIGAGIAAIAAAIGIGKSHLDYRQCFCIDTKAFAIELLALRLLLKCLYIVEVNHYLLSVNVFNNSFSDCIVSDSVCIAFWKSRMASCKSICSSGSNVST